MSEIHGRLLIGGMILRDLYGSVALKSDCPSAEWCGHLLVDPADNEYLETGRSYRLELDDGRSGKIVVTRVECLIGQRRLRVLFDGISALSESRPERAESRPVRETVRFETAPEGAWS